MQGGWHGAIEARLNGRTSFFDKGAAEFQHADGTDWSIRMLDRSCFLDMAAVAAARHSAGLKPAVGAL
jgi:hypothetical protein